MRHEAREQPIRGAAGPRISHKRILSREKIHRSSGNSLHENRYTGTANHWHGSAEPPTNAPLRPPCTDSDQGGRASLLRGRGLAGGGNLKYEAGSRR
jgi:hypothetical protein